MPHKEINEALNHHQTGKIAKAREIYNKILTKNPTEPDALHLLGILESQEKNFGLALKLIKQAKKIDPNNASIHNNLGNIFKNLGEINKAKEEYEEALRIDPNSASAHNNLANILAKQNKMLEAITHYREAIRIRPEYTDAHYNLGLLLAKQGKNEETLLHLEAIILWDPENVSALENAGAILGEQGNFDKAINYLEKALEKEPEHIETLKNLGAIFLIKKNLDRALQCYLKVLLIAPELDIHYNIAVIYMDQGRYNDAIEYFSHVLKINPNDFRALNNIGAIYLKVGDYPKAIEYYKTALQIEPDNTEITYLLAALTQDKTPKRAPKEYIQNLFDQYAPNFDTHLTKFLEYDVPNLIYMAVSHPPLPLAALNTEKEKVASGSGGCDTVLDLGCGTGLAGEKFRSIAKTLIGIDLSGEMLNAAREKNIYDELKQSDIHSALANYHNNIDVIIAADTLVYIGDLDELFNYCHTALKKGGIFVFTSETTDIYPYILQKTARFAHSKKYIETLAKKYGFSITQEQEITLRKQKNLPVNGVLWKFILF